MLMQSAKSLSELENNAEFIARHIGIDAADEAHMLSVVGSSSRRALIDGIVPRSIVRGSAMAIPLPVSEAAALRQLKEMAAKVHEVRLVVGTQGMSGLDGLLPSGFFAETGAKRGS